MLLTPAAPLAGERIAAAFIRAGVPGELIAVLHGPDALAAVPSDPDSRPGDGPRIDRVVDLGDDEAKATMLVLDGAPLEAAVSGALWAAFAGAGRHPAAVGRLVVAPGPAEPLLEALVAGAQRLRVGDPQHADTEVGPLASRADLEAVERLVAEAEAGGAERLCGGPLDLPGLDGAFCAPVVLRGVRADARLMREMPPGPVLAVVEAGSDAQAIALAAEHADAAISVWTDDRRARRARRALAGGRAVVGERARAVGAVSAVRLARHVAPQRLASQPRAGAQRALAPVRPGARTRARRPPPDCCTAGRASAWRPCATARCRSPASHCAPPARRLSARTGRGRTARARPTTARRSRPAPPGVP